MRTLKLLSILLLVLGLAACGGTQEVTAPPPTAPEGEPAVTVERSEFSLDEITYPDLPEFEIPQPRRVELDNGLTIFLIEDRELPVVNASARVGTGSVYEPADHAGLASITGNVMRTGGTEAMTPDELDTFLEDRGASIETGIGEASGSAFMSTLKENLDEVLPVFVDVLQHPAFREEKVALAKTQTKSAISRRNDDPQQIAFREFAKIVYGEDSPYARTTEYYTVDEVTRDDLVTFHRRFFVPNNVLLSVWGDFDADAMAAQLEEAFGGWERDPAFVRPELPEVTAERDYSVHFIPKEDVTQSTVLMGHVGEITRDHPDYFPVIVMNEVLSGGFTSRLFNTVRTEMGLAYAVFGSYGANYDRAGTFNAGVFTKSETTVEAAEAVLNEIDKLTQAPPTDEEVQLAKDAFLNSFVFNFDTRQEIVNRMMTYEYYGYPMDFLEQIREGVEAVTPADVHRVAQRYLHPEEVDLLVLGKQDDFDQPLTALADGGTVHEIDITIPLAPPGEQDAVPASAEALDEGRAMLEQAAEALGGVEAFAAVEGVRATSQQTAQTPMGEMTIDVITAIEMPVNFRIEQSTPMGEMVLVADEGGATLQTPQGTQQLPAAATEQIRGQLWRDLTYLFAHLDEEALQVQSLGEETVEGETLQALRVTPPAGTPYTLYLDPETMRPARMHYQGQTMQGAPVAAQDHYSDYREVEGGLTLPFQTVTYHDGEQAGTSVLQSVEINPTFEPGMFELE